MEKPPITELDCRTIAPELQLFKAIIPFFDYATQAKLSTIIRIYELQQTLSFYQYANQVLQFSIQNEQSQKSLQLSDFIENPAIRSAILPYLPEQYKTLFNNWEQFHQLSSILQTARASQSASNATASNDHPDSPKSTHTTPISDALQNPLQQMFTPNQQKLYDEYLAQLDELDRKLNTSDNQKNNT